LRVVIRFTLLTKIVAGDESWVFAYDSGDDDAVSRVAHSVVSPTKEITPRQIQGKSDAHCIDGVVHREFSPPGQTVNGHFYVQVDMDMSYTRVLHP
jgi:hypothetical protein